MPWIIIILLGVGAVAMLFKKKEAPLLTRETGGGTDAGSNLAPPPPAEDMTPEQIVSEGKRVADHIRDSGDQLAWNDLIRLTTLSVTAHTKLARKTPEDVVAELAHIGWRREVVQMVVEEVRDRPQRVGSSAAIIEWVRAGMPDLGAPRKKRPTKKSGKTAARRRGAAPLSTLETASIDEPGGIPDGLTDFGDGDADVADVEE